MLLTNDTIEQVDFMCCLTVKHTMIKEPTFLVASIAPL